MKGIEGLTPSTPFAERWIIIMKKIRCMFILLAILLSNVMCVVVAFNYGKMLWGVENAGYSAPASTAFLWAIPFLICIAICIIIVIVAQKR